MCTILEIEKTAESLITIDDGDASAVTNMGKQHYQM